MTQREIITIMLCFSLSRIQSGFMIKVTFLTSAQSMRSKLWINVFLLLLICFSNFFFFPILFHLVTFAFMRKFSIKHASLYSLSCCVSASLEGTLNRFGNSYSFASQTPQHQVCVYLDPSSHDWCYTTGTRDFVTSHIHAGTVYNHGCYGSECLLTCPRLQSTEAL